MGKIANKQLHNNRWPGAHAGQVKRQKVESCKTYCPTKHIAGHIGDRFFTGPM